MDRIHRLGQHRPVHAIKLVVEDSIESRIVQLQEKKAAMVDATLSTDDSAMGRLTAEDLGGYQSFKYMGSSTSLNDRLLHRFLIPFVGYLEQIVFKHAYRDICLVSVLRSWCCGNRACSQSWRSYKCYINGYRHD